MRFRDSSALVPLLVTEPSSEAVSQEFGRDPEVVAWWGTDLECVSALARLERDGSLAAASVVDALNRLDALSLAWREIQPVARVRQMAIRLLRVHPLRASDALQLGAAIVASEDQPASLPLVTLDDRLGQAAEREGFRVVRPDGAVRGRAASP
jgi:predicted nucleic acid-binding protein